MKKVLGAAAVFAAAMAVAGPPAIAASGDCHLTLTTDDEGNPVQTTTNVCREDDWFHQGALRLSNDPNNSVPGWDKTKPSAAFGQGGAVYAAVRPIDMLESSPSVRPTYGGTFTGTLDNIAVTFYAASAYSALGGTNSLILKLTVDGEPVYDNSGLDDLNVAVTKVSDEVYSQSFAFTDLAAALKAMRLPNGPATKHTIEFSFVNKYWGDSNFVTFYDSSEYPAGVIFNLEQDPDSAGLPGYTEVSTTA